MSTVLMTGATGFVGGHVAAVHRRAGHEIRCSVRATSDLRGLAELGAELCEADLRHDDLDRVVGGVERVVHVAGLTRARHAAAYGTVNATATVRLARAAARAGVRRFVFLSSLAARGPDGSHGPTSPYGRSKRDAEEGLRTMESDMEVVVLRPGAIYGPGDRELLPLFRLAARGLLPVPPGDRRVQPLFVEDVAEATLRAGEAATGFGPHAVAGAERLGWDAVRRRMQGVLGRRIRAVRLPAAVFLAAGAAAEWAVRLAGGTPRFDRRRATDVAFHTWTCDLGPAERELGWRPRTPVAEGFRRTVAWYREVGWLSGGTGEAVGDAGRRGHPSSRAGP